VLSHAFSFVLVLAVQFWMFSWVFRELVAGNLFLASIFGVCSLLYLWATGSCYVTLPVSAYFQLKYRSDPNYLALERLHRQAARLLRALPFRKTRHLETTLSNLGVLRLCQGDYEGAEKLFAESINSLEKSRLRNKSTSMIILYSNLGVTYLRQGKYVEAELQAAKALEIAESPGIAKRYPIMQAPPLAVHAAARLHLGETESAVDCYKQALTLYESSALPPYHSAIAYKQGLAFCNLGLALATIKLGQQQESLQALDKAWKMAVDDPGIMSTLALNTLNLLANEYINNKLFDQAEELLQLAYSVGFAHPFHPESKKVLSYYEKLLLLTDRQSEVHDMRQWLRPVPKIGQASKSAS
jgi:tetratricopeptide (TPR) repeat protein